MEETNESLAEGRVPNVKPTFFAADGRLENLEPRVLYSAEGLPVLANFDDQNFVPLQTLSSVEELLAVAHADKIPHTSQQFSSLNSLPANLLSNDFSPELTSDSISESEVAANDSLFSSESESTPRELVIVDTTHDDLADLYQRMIEFPDHGRNVVIVELDGSQQGLAGISAVLENYSGLSAVHLLSHGSDGILQLANSSIGIDQLEEAGSQLAAWSDALIEGGDLLLYGCNLASGDTGLAFANQLSSLSGLDVAASDDITGSVSESGDWDLEVRFGDIKVQEVVTEDVQARWSGSLATVSITTASDHVDGNTSSIVALQGSPGADGFISLREAIIASNNDGGGHVLQLGAGSYPLGIVGDGEDSGATGDLDISSVISIQGVSGANTTIFDTGIGDRLFDIQPGGLLALDNLDVIGGSANVGGTILNDGVLHAFNTTLSNGSATTQGGSIYNSGVATLDNVTIRSSGAQTGFGGGIHNSGGTMDLTNTTVTQNSATGGGGIFSIGGTVTIEFSTISSNSSTSVDGGGIYSSNGISINHSIVSDNVAATGIGNDISGTVSSGGYNVIEDGSGMSGSIATDSVGVDPMLQPFADNGGEVWTQAITAASIAHDFALLGIPTDARGEPRDGNPDAGAFELIGANNPPILSGLEGFGLAFTENDPPTPVTTAVTVSDSNDTHMESAEVAIVANYEDGEDVLTFTDTPNITGTWSQLEGKLDLSGTDTVANYQAALRSVTYNNTSETPVESLRTIQLVVNDGDSNSNSVQRFVIVTATDDIPVLSVLEGFDLTHYAPNPPSVITNTIDVSDVDDSNLLGAKILISANYVQGEDLLDFADTANIISSWDPILGELTLSGNDSLANYRDALRAVTYENTGGVPTVGLRTIAFSGQDDSGLYSDPLSRQVLVQPGGAEEVLVTNQPTVVERGTTVTMTPLELLTTDPDTPSSQLVYTLTGYPIHATIYNGATLLAANDTYTQQDINDGLITVVADAAPPVLGDLVSFTVDDGQGTETSAVHSYSYPSIKNIPPYFASIPSGYIETAPGVASNVSSVASGDLDGDGDLDVVATTDSPGEVVWFENDGTGTLGAPISISLEDAPVSVVVDDIDLDGDMDVIVGNAPSVPSGVSIVIYYNDGAGSFLPYGFVESGFQTTSLAVGDVDDDGDKDIVIGVAEGGAGNVTVFYANGGSWTSDTTDAGWKVLDVEIADLNADGHTDIVATTGQATKSLAYVRADATPQPIFSVTEIDVPNVEAIKIVDMDLDGDFDIVTAGGTNLSWIESSGATDPVFVNHLIVSEPSFTTSLDVTELTADGYPDVVTSRQDGTITSYLNNGVDPFARHPLTTVSTNPAMIEMVDLSGDGFSDDVIIANTTANSVATLRKDIPDGYLRAVANEDITFPIAGLSMGDPDIATDDLAVAIVVDDGVVSLATITNLTFFLGDGVNDSQMTFTGSLADVNFALSTLNFQGDPNFSGETNIGIVVDDQGHTGAGGVKSTSLNLRVDVLAVNDAPNLGSAGLTGIDEDDTNPSGETFNSIFGGIFSDVDPGSSLAGVAVTSNPSTAAEGLWMYSNDNLTWWTIPGTASNTNALLLSATDSIRFLPAADYNGAPPSLQLHAVDDSFSWIFSNGAARSWTDLSTTGGSTPYSLVVSELSTFVSPVADPPTITSAILGNSVEDTNSPSWVQLALAYGISFNDPDVGDSLSGVLVVANPVNFEGVWEYSSDAGTSWFDVGSVTNANGLLLATTDYVRFSPAADFSGNVPPLTVHALDSTFAGAFTAGAARSEMGGPDGSTAGFMSPTPAMMQTNVTAVNDSPVAQTVTLAAVAQDTTNPNGETVSNLYSPGFTDVDSPSSLGGIAIVGNSGGPEGDWEYSSDGLNWFPVGPVGLANALVLSPTDNVRFLPAPGFVGVPPVLSVYVLDDTYPPAGSYTNGAVRVEIDTVGQTPADPISTGWASLSTSVTGTNTAPSIGDSELAAISEDTANPAGISVQLLASPSFVDADAGSFMTGIAVVVNAATVEGIWQYDSSASGTQWNDIGAVSEASALVLDPVTLIRFLPATNYYGTPPSLQIVALDNTYSGGFTANLAKELMSVDTRGGGTAISALSGLLEIEVTPANDAPQGVSGTIADIIEDEVNPVGDTVENLFLANWLDVDSGDSFSGIAVIDNSEAIGGTWQFSNNGFDWADVGAVSDTAGLILSTQDFLRFLPAGDYSGIPLALNVKLMDSTYGGTYSTVGANTYQNVVTSDATEYFSVLGYELSTEVIEIADAPSMSDGLLPGVDEDTENPLGQTVDSLFSSTFIDPDAAGPVFGIAIVENAVANEGLWQYSQDSGVSWLDVDVVSETSALILKSTDKLRFVGALNYNGIPPALIVHGLDATWLPIGAGTVDRPLDDVSIRGGTTSISDQVSQVVTVVHPINDAPSIGASELPTIFEDATSPAGEDISSLLAGHFADVDLGDSLVGILVHANASAANEGEWQFSFNGVNWLALPDVQVSNALALDADSRIRFVPSAQYNGVPGALEIVALDSTFSGIFSSLDNLSYSAMTPAAADSSQSNSAVVRIEVTPVDDVPQVNADEYVIGRGEILTANFSDNDVNNDSDTLTSIVLAAPLHGVVQLSAAADGNFTYEHDGTTDLVDNFVYQTQDSTGNTVQAVVTINVLPSNDPPLVTLTNQMNLLPEDTDTAIPFKVADIVITDDGLGVNSLSLSGIDAARFEINGSELFLAAGAVLDHETASQLRANVDVSDNSISPGPHSSEEFVLSLVDVNEAPSVWLINNPGFLAEDTDTTQPVRVADIVVTDDDIGINTLIVTGPDAAFFEIAGNELFLKVGTMLDFEQQPVYRVVIEVDDPTIGVIAENRVEQILQISDVVEPAAVEGVESTRLTYTENQSPTVVSPGISLSSVNSDAILSAEVTFAAGYSMGEDLLDFSSQSGITGSYDESLGVLQLTGSASAQAYEAAMRSVTYANSSDNPNIAPRIIEFTVTDSIGHSTPVGRIVDVVAVNDEEVIAINTGVALTAVTPHVLLASELAVSDPDNRAADLVYTVVEANVDVILLVNGQQATSFSQLQLERGAVSLVSVGENIPTGVLRMTVDDGMGTVSDVTLPISEAPALGAGTAVEDPNKEITIPISFAIYEETEADENGPDSGDAGELSVGENVGIDNDLLGVGGLLSEPEIFSIPEIPESLRDIDLAELVADGSNLDRRIAEENNEEIVDNQLASLLSLAPISIENETKSLLQWRLANAGFQASLNQLKDNFDAQSQAKQKGKIISDTLVGSSLGLTAGFVVWVLRGGTLVASLFSIAPLWKQLDPLPIVSRSASVEDDSDLDDDSVEVIFDAQKS